MEPVDPRIAMRFLQDRGDAPSSEQQERGERARQAERAARDERRRDRGPPPGGEDEVGEGAEQMILCSFTFRYGWNTSFLESSLIS